MTAWQGTPTAARTTDRFQQVSVQFEHVNDRFDILFGYKGRNACQLRLEEDGTISAFDSREDVMHPDQRIESAHNVPIEVFAPAFRQFVRSLAALKAERAAKEGR